MNRWTVLTIAWLALLLSFVDRLAWSSVASSVAATASLPLAALGSFASAFFAGYVVSNLVGGVLVDRLGARIGLATALLALGMFTIGFSFITTISGGVAVQALMGLAAGADYAAAIKLVAAWFPPKQRARAIGILMTSLPLALIVASSGIPFALHHVAWPAVYRSLGAATVLFGLALLPLLQDAPTTAASRRVTPADILSVLREPELARLAFVGFSASWGTWGFAFWATALMSKGAGLTPAAAGLATSLFAMAAIVAKPVIGAISDRMGGRRKAPIVAVLLVYALGLLLFGQLHGALQFQLAALALGFFGFSAFPLISTLVAEVGGNQTAGTATGTTNAVQQMAGVLVPVAIGSVFAATGSFGNAFLVMAAGPAVALVIMALFCRDAEYAK